MQSSDYIKQICTTGTDQDRRDLFSFTVEMPNKKILKKFQLFSRTYYSRYFQDEDADFHPLIILDLIDSYKGVVNIGEAGARGIAKTALLKLFDTFVLANDKSAFRRFIKVMSKDISNSRQITTDVYNMLLELEKDYGDLFLKDGKKKQEETMGGFTMVKEVNDKPVYVKFTAGTVGQDQRGHIQDAFRPDWLQFEDIEDKKSIRSLTVTQGVIDQCQEAIDGLAKGGSYLVNCNYISDQGTVQWFMDKPNIRFRITPIATDIDIGDVEGKTNLVKATATWARYTLQDLRNLFAESEDWYGEYMCDPTRSSDKFFDLDIIDSMLKGCIEPLKESQGVRYYGEYKPHHGYGLGADTSEGIGRDANTLVGFNFTTGEQIVSYNNNRIAPDIFGYETVRVGEEFGNCILAIERNNTGHATIASAKGYQNLYREETIGNVRDKATQRYGWNTNSRTKPLMFFQFKRDFNDGLITIYDDALLMEMRHYTQDDLQDHSQGLITRHFDLLTAAVIAWQMKDHVRIGKDLNLKQHYQKMKYTNNYYGAAS